MNKATIRSQLQSARKQLTPAEAEQHSQATIKHITASTFWADANHVAIYLPCGGEIDLRPLLDVSAKHFYLPSIKGQHMQFQRWHHKLAINPHRFGMQQPDFINELPPAKLDLCLMPLVGFDGSGNRLGMGGGFYDRYFEHNDHTTLAGVAHQCQQVDSLPVDSWDVKLHHIFTEQGHHEF